MDLKGLIFDFGFTLFEFKDVSVERYLECYKKGLDKSIEKLKELDILFDNEVISKFIKTFTKERAANFKESIRTKNEVPTFTIYKQVLEKLNIKEQNEDFYFELANLYHSFEENEWIPFVKTKQTLEKLSKIKTLKMAVLSNHPNHATIENLLKKHDLLRFFDTVVTSAEFGKRKPHPEIFFYTLQKMGLEKPESCLICGDEHADIIGGHRAGLQTILCKRLFKFPFEKEIEMSNILQVNDISEILNLIDNIKKN